MNKIIVVALIVVATLAGRLPSPICRTSPLPSVIPVSIGQTVRFDLENLFTGYNLVFEGAKKDHIQVTPKYEVNSSSFPSSKNFTNAKIKEHNRFLGLTASNELTELSIGTNHPESGIVIETTIKIQDQPQLHCFDVEEIVERENNKAYAIIDCGAYRMGQLYRNEFIFVDLDSKKVVLGSKVNDVFVRYNHLIKRRIQVIMDPFTRMQYLFRFYTVDGVDNAHANRTYVEIFMHSSNIMKIQILDIIDHTTFDLDTLSILDFQIHFNFIYLLVKQHGLYQLQFTPTQRIIKRAFMPIKMNVQRFVVEQNGFNDDLHLVFSNENTIYQFQWDVTSPPVLKTKYSLMANSKVEDLLMDQHFVIVQVWETVDTELERRTWIFSRRTLSYTNAYGSFHEPNFGPSIMIYSPFDRILHLIHQYQSLNIRLNIPYLINSPVADQKAGETETYLVKATSSTGREGEVMQCRLTLNFLYIKNTNTSIIKTGLQGRNQTFVDAPDDAEFNLQYEFFGRNISYNVKTNNVDNKTNSTVVPESYVQKYVKAGINFPPEIDQNFIVYYQMFGLTSLEQIQDKDQIYGVVQVQQSGNSFPIFYISCYVQLDQQFMNPSLKCKVQSKSNLSNGKIKQMSQMFSTKQRFAAIVFVGDQTNLFLYYMEPHGFQYYGHKKFGYDYLNMMTGVEVTAKNQVIVIFEYGKRLEVYRVEDIRNDQEKPAVPLFTIDSRVMAFFGVQYFAPVKAKISIYHDQVTFVQTKTGVMAMNINEQGFPQLLFHIRTPTPRYDFEVNRDTLITVTQTNMVLYRLTVPLRRRQQPIKLQQYDSDFNLNEYDEINSDGLFYLVEKQDSMLLVVHPNMPSTSVIYTQFYIGKIVMIDAVKLNDKQVLFVYNGTKMLAYVFAQNPKLRIRWQPNQPNFTMQVSAYNEGSRSQPYQTLFSIIQSNQAFINTTDKFNPAAIRKAGYVQAKKNNKIMVNLNITLNDTQWFTGNVMYYQAKCAHCHQQNVSDKDFQITLQNHMKQLNTQIKVGEPVYDMKSTYQGIYGQMYDSIFKTHATNSTIHYIVKIPTKSRGQVCTKLAVNTQQDYLLSFCESGISVNIYITTNLTTTPKTTGPYQTQAQAVNHVEVVNNVLMIVDNDDDPLNRAGGVYLYYINMTEKNIDDKFNMLDYIDYEDLQIQGFRGRPFVGSADFHKPMFNKDQYAIFLTESRTGNIFVILFQISQNKEQVVYLHKKLLELNKLLPETARHPTPLRVININIVDYTVKTIGQYKTQYVLLLTVKNWHHIELMLTFDQDYDLLTFQVSRLFERVPYPWELTNYIRLRKGSLNASYFALSYRDYYASSQIIVVYYIPYFNINGTDPNQYMLPQASIPVTRVLGAHRILDTAQITFDFNTRDQHRILFNDAMNPHLSQIELNRQLKLIIKNADPTKNDGENITIIAENHYTNVSFVVEFKFNFDKDDDDDDDKGNKTEIIWIIILVVGFVVIVGLIFVWSRQKRSSPRDSAAIKQSLLTVQPEFKNNFINRSSADPESIRGTVDYTANAPVAEQKKLKRQGQEQGSDDQEQEPKKQSQAPKA